MKSAQTMILLATLGLGLTGCANMNNTQSGALAGTGLGAVAGAIVGEASGHPGAVPFTCAGITSPPHTRTCQFHRC